jgi:hypothetical protein
MILRHASNVHARWLILICASVTLDCQDGHVCSGVVSCVSSQAEADSLNVTSGCQNYIYCPTSDVDAGDAARRGRPGTIAAIVEATSGNYLAHERQLMSGPNGGFQATKLEVVALATGWQGRRFKEGRRDPSRTGP